MITGGPRGRAARERGGTHGNAKRSEPGRRKYRVIAVDPRSQGESDTPNCGHLAETRARDYKQLVDQLRLKQPVLVGWSMGCGELLSYIEQFGEDGIGGLVLVDGLIRPIDNPSVTSVLSQWTVTLQQDRQKEAAVFAHAMFKKPEPEDYINKVAQATLPNAEFVKAHLGDKVRLERFDGDGHALFVHDPVKFNHMVDVFVQSLPRQ